MSRSLYSIEDVIKWLGYPYSGIPEYDTYCFTIQPGDTKKIIRLRCKNYLLNASLEEVLADKLNSLFYNNIWPPKDLVLDEGNIQEFVDQYYPSQAPDDKAIRVLQLLHTKTRFDGDFIYFESTFPNGTDEWRRSYVRNWEEFKFYIQILKQRGLAEYDDEGYGHSTAFSQLRITADGLSKIIAEKEKQESRNCFVAMSFHDELITVYDHAIAPAIVESGFTPVLIRDHKEIPSDQTINDAILAAIKKSRFTIADFTHHRAGVYFEAGYALGRGQKVIYTCRADELERAHFDTRNYPHIAWHTAEDLKQQLLDKIEVFIHV